MTWKNEHFVGSESPLSGGNDALLQSWKGREVPQDKSKAMQQMLLVTQWVSVFSLGDQTVFLQAQRTAEHAVTMSLTEYQELAPKLTYSYLNSPLFFLTIGKKILLPFYEVNCAFVLACLHLLAYMQGRSLAVPTCAWQHLCHQSHGCWALLCWVGHIAMTEKQGAT